MKKHRRMMILFLAANILWTCLSWAAEKKEPTADVDRAPGEKHSETRHTLALEGMKFTYTAVAGELLITRPDKKAKGSVFFVAYELEEIDRSERPVTFAFNGGPGAASVWLHLGALGPKRVCIGDDGKALPPPPRYTDNPHTWLLFSDLVFVDPIGTGFSRSKSDDKKKTAALFYGVEEDIQSMGEFIRLYLSKKERWGSPKFLVGESYGTTRVAALTSHLQERYGIDLNGIVLVSPVLDFETILFHPSNDLPYQLFLPTYAASAWYHGLLREELQNMRLDNLVDEVAAYCIGEYTVSLAKGASIGITEQEQLATKLSAFTSLSQAYIRTHRFRINPAGFTKFLLEKDGRLIGRMDATVTGVDPDPGSPYPSYDPSLNRLYGPFSGAMNSYLRRELRYESNRVYEFLNEEVNRRWDWSSGLTRDQGFVTVSHTLREAMAVSDHLRVFIACGLYDLTTPYFAAEHTLNHMWLGTQRENTVIKKYRSGHMIYTHAQARKQLFEDVRAFYKHTGKQ